MISWLLLASFARYHYFCNHDRWQLSSALSVYQKISISVSDKIKSAQNTLLIKTYITRLRKAHEWPMYLGVVLYIWQECLKPPKVGVGEEGQRIKRMKEKKKNQWINKLIFNKKRQFAATFAVKRYKKQSYNVTYYFHHGFHSITDTETR